MSAPAYWEWPVWVDSDEPETFTLSDLSGRVDLTSSAVSIVIRWAGDGGGITLTEAAGVTVEDQSDPVTKGMFTVRLSLAQRALLPTDTTARYQVARVADGVSSAFFYGEIVATNWVDANA